MDEHKECPGHREAVVGEGPGAYGQLVFPHGIQKCVTVVGAKCGAPSFKINNFASYLPEDYEIYWAEWDSSMIPRPSKVLGQFDMQMKPSMSLSDKLPRLDTNFVYTGVSSQYHAGFPGRLPSDECPFDDFDDLGCVFSLTELQPKEVMQKDRLRSLTWGLGKPTTGQYDVGYGGWKAWGG